MRWLNRVLKIFQRGRVNIQDVSLTKDQLESIPENERVFFVQIGHLGNELSILHKLVYFTGHRRDAVQIEQSAQVAQQTLLSTVLAGKLAEGWQMLQSDFFGNQLSKVYEPLRRGIGIHSRKS